MIYDPIPAYRFLTDKPLGSYAFRAAHGGRGSAKSWSVVDAAIFHTVTTPRLRVVLLREIMANLRESSMELVRSRLEHFGLLNTYFREVDGQFLGLGGQKIMFIGLWKGNKPDGIKSLEGAGLTILEEAQEVRQASLDVLLPTILRTAISELWAIWNPRLATDPIDVFFRGPVRPKRAIVRKINYDQNPHFPEALRELMALDRQKDPLRAGWIWDGKYMPSVQGAIWTRGGLDWAWQAGRGVTDGWGRVVVGVDPSGGGDDVGIVAVAEYGEGAIVLEDATCPATSPMAWATAVAKCVDRWGADAVIAEKNFGGDMVESTLRAASVRARVVMVTASRGKHVRAEPVAALYDQNRIRHHGQFAAMEAEMLMTTPAGYQGDASPNRLDALVWAISDLKLEAKSSVALFLSKRNR
ncbi:MAG: terminase [Brevundimonas sp.]|nr:MAG: terminase [Brevundimonas sp.]